MAFQRYIFSCVKDVVIFFLCIRNCILLMLKKMMNAEVVLFALLRMN